jgi:arylsulfatase A-like enzyme
MRSVFGLAALLAVAASAPLAARAAPHNVVIFVADGLRYGSVDEASAPEMAHLRRDGVDFADSHSVYPTITTVNAAAIATGHLPGDTGDFVNTIFVGEPGLPEAYLSLTAGLEDDAVLGGMNARFGGDYLGRPTLLEAARKAGFQTAAIGKAGPTAIQDVTARDGASTIIIDDATGTPDGLRLPPDVVAAIKARGLDTATPDRGLNTDPGTAIMPGVQVANVQQQDWFARVAAEVILPRFAAAGRPFILVFWSRDPDGTQHNEGDSLNTLTPGINGPTSLAAVRNADSDLGRLRAALKRLGLENTTDIVVTADHGFSVTSRQSHTSPAAGTRYPDTPAGFLPSGFLALDLGKALDLPVHDPNGVDLVPFGHPHHASAVLGADVTKPRVVIAANGASDALWLPAGDRADLARRIVEAVTAQDYTAAIFVADDLAPLGGALPMSAIGLKGAARTPAPDILVAFRSGVIPGCDRGPELCGLDVADGDLQQGQGIHGTLSRADTRNMMAAAGPDFKAGFVDPAPVGNADWAPTLAHVLGLTLDGPGDLRGRIMIEALRDGPPPPSAEAKVVRSPPAANGFVTVLKAQALDGETYLDAAGAPGRALGSEPEPAAP